MIYLSERQRCGPRGSVEACGTLLSILPLGNATTVRTLLCGAFLPEKSTSAGMRALTAALKALKQLPLWTWETCLPEHAERAYGTVCSAGRTLPFAEKNLTAVAAVPATLNLPLAAGRLGRPSRPIAASRQ